MGDGLRPRLLDAAIAVLLGIICARILSASEPRAVFAGYAVMAMTAATLPVLFGAVWLGLRKS